MENKTTKSFIYKLKGLILSILRTGSKVNGTYYKYRENQFKKRA